MLERMNVHPAVHPKTEYSSPYDHPDFTGPLISTPKSVAIHRCLSRVKFLSLHDHCEYSALTFPLFIAGCESDVPEHRNLVSRSLSKLEANFGIGNVKRAKEMLNLLWARRDAIAEDPISVKGTILGKAHWLDILEELQWELILV